MRQQISSDLSLSLVTISEVITMK